MDLKKKVLNTIKKHKLIENGDTVVLGLSGGPDSVALFDVLKNLILDYKKTNGKFGLDIEICPVHVNHMLRPGDCDEDQAFVEKLARKYSEETDGQVHEAEVFPVDCNALKDELGVSSEEAGRIARYEAFVTIAEEMAEAKTPMLLNLVYDEDGEPMDNVQPLNTSCVKIAVAHNSNDQAETVLFRILRGTGLEGLSGIQVKRVEKVAQNEFYVVRPLLECSRSDVEEYCRAQGLNPRMDHTNELPVYTRNKLRLDLLPKLREEYNANIVETLNRLAETASVDLDFIEGCAREGFEKASVGVGSLDIMVLQELHKAVRYRVYQMSLLELGMDEGLTKVGLDMVDNIVEKFGKKSATAELSNGYFAYREKQVLKFEKR